MLSFGKAALQADDKRQVLPNPRIHRVLSGRAAERGLGFAQVL